MDKATQAEFASFVGISEARASQLVTEGVLPASGTLRDWTRAYCERLRRQAAGRVSENDPQLTEERARLARVKREREELRLEEERGALISVDAVRMALAPLLVSTRDALLQIPARTAALLAAETDAGEVHKLLFADLCRALDLLSRRGCCCRGRGRTMPQPSSACSIWRCCWAARARSATA